LDELLDAADDLQTGQGSRAHKSASMFIKVLNHMRGFPHPSTQAMAESLWEIIYHNLVFVSLAEAGEEMALVIHTLECNFQQAMIRVPQDWIDAFLDDPIFQLGGALYAGSQAVDFYNGIFTADPDVSGELAAAHEAEVIKLALYEFPTYEIDDYQRQLLQLYPEGLNSPRAKELIYPLAPVQAIEA
jgi:hypothetical protein